MRIFNKIQQRLQWSSAQYLRFILQTLLLVYVASAIYHSIKPLPQGLAFKGKFRHAEVRFLSDQTYLDQASKQQQQHAIFDSALQMIAQAQNTIVMDMFLFNPSVGQSKVPQRALSGELTQALLAKKQQNPSMDIVVITDPINSVYGGQVPEHLQQLRAAGVQVLETDLSPLRASNPLWSGWWYLCCQHLGNNPNAAWLKNPFGTGQITLRSYLHLLNFKANHRKTLVVDGAQGWQTLVSSANPHDGSSRHSNVALQIQGPTAADVLQTEQAVARFSGGSVPSLLLPSTPTSRNLPQVRILTEAAIYQAVLELIDSAQAGQHLDLAMFYLSERHIIQALKAAQQRGVKLRVLLDPNKDAFGLKKNGIPNRPVAAELHTAGVPIRWCNTHGEQCHSKLLMLYDQRNMHMILGSANFTARNLKNYNLETNAQIKAQMDSQLSRDARLHFDVAWGNLQQKNMSVDYAQYADASRLKYWTYRFMEWSGLSTF